jgi:uncharacterized protein
MIIIMQPKALRWIDGLARLSAAVLLGRLRDVAPVYAISGNVDDEREWGEGVAGKGGRSGGLTTTEPSMTFDHSGIRFWVAHGHKIPMTKDPRDLSAEVMEQIREARPHVVVCGHSHVPVVDALGGCLYLNPGSAGPKRFTLPRCFMTVHVVRLSEYLGEGSEEEGCSLTLTEAAPPPPFLRRVEAIWGRDGEEVMRMTVKLWDLSLACSE